MTTCAVIFAGLGSLAECADTDRLAWNSAFRTLGMRWEWSWEAYSELMRNGGDRSLVSRFARFVGEDLDSEKLGEAHQRHFAARMSGQQMVRPGVAETMIWAARHSISLGFVSRYRPGVVHPLLNATARARAGVEFDVVVTSSDPARTAPHPDGVELAMERLRVTDAVVIADTPASAAAGLDAGLDTIAFPGLLAEEWHFPAGVIGPAAPSPDLIGQLLSSALRTAAE